MGRPPLGSAAKTQPTSVRITESERKLLERIYGSPSKALRAILDAYLANYKKESQ